MAKLQGVYQLNISLGTTKTWISKIRGVTKSNTFVKHE